MHHQWWSDILNDHHTCVLYCTASCVFVNSILVSFCVHGLNIKVVDGKTTSHGVDCRPVDLGACETECSNSLTGPQETPQDAHREK